MGNQNGQFNQKYFCKSPIYISKSIITIDIPDILKRYPDEKYVERHSYSFKSFKLVGDIILKSNDYFLHEGQEVAHSWLLSWGGDPDDLSQYIDLATGELVITEQVSTLVKTVYNSILMQINAPAETIIPDFGEDKYNVTTFSWGDLKPFFSTNSSTQHILLSTYVKEPFVKWVEGPMPDWFYDLETVKDFKLRFGRDLVDFGDWIFSAPINQEFFDGLNRLNFTTDPCSGEAWLFLPLYESIDLTNMDYVSFVFEFFMKDLLETYIDIDGNVTYVLSSSKTYTDQDNRIYYSPLPIAVSYKENTNGFVVSDIQQ